MFKRSEGRGIRRLLETFDLSDTHVVRWEERARRKRSEKLRARFKKINENKKKEYEAVMKLRRAEYERDTRGKPNFRVQSTRVYRKKTFDGIKLPSILFTTSAYKGAKWSSATEERNLEKLGNYATDSDYTELIASEERRARFERRVFDIERKGEVSREKKLQTLNGTIKTQIPLYRNDAEICVTPREIKNLLFETVSATDVVRLERMAMYICQIDGCLRTHSGRVIESETACEILDFLDIGAFERWLSLRMEEGILYYAPVTRPPPGINKELRKYTATQHFFIWLNPFIWFCEQIISDEVLSEFISTKWRYSNRYNLQILEWLMKTHKSEQTK